jgi:acetyl-CoA carboxylase carboxyl transferase subunit beta
VRVAVDGATVGFAGPRVVEALTGARPLPQPTPRSAADAGRVDAVLPADRCRRWVVGSDALTPRPEPVPPPEPREPALAGSEQVRRRGRPSRRRDCCGGCSPTSSRCGAARRPTVAACLALRRPAGGGRRAGAEVHTGRRRTATGCDPGRRLAGRLGLPLLSLVDTPGAEPGTAAEQDGVAAAMGETLDALLTCPSPTLALVHGEGGSGGALAVAATDVLLLTPDSYFAAIGPEGAAAALRRPPDQCADLMRVTPRDLLALGAADAVVEPDAVAGALAQLLSVPTQERRARRQQRWAEPLPGVCHPLVM